MAREAHRSESLAVGSQSFVMRACQAHANRREFEFLKCPAARVVGVCQGGDVFLCRRFYLKKTV